MKNSTDATTTMNFVFFLKNAQHNTKPLELYLERRGFKMETENSIPAALEKIKESKPDYVFVAWDHMDRNIQNILSLITGDAIVIPYITSTSGPDTRKLMGLNMPIKMFPPLSGPAIQRLVLKLQKERLDLKGSHSQNSGSSKQDVGDSQVYVNKGQRFSDMNKVITDRITNDSSYVSLFDSITDLSIDRPTAQFSKNMQFKISEGQKKSLEAKFDGKIQDELKDIIETTKEFTTEEHQQTIFCMLVQSIDCSGLILLNTSWNMNLEDAESALSSWANELTFQYHKNDGVKNIYQSEVFSVSTPAELNVLEICASKAAVQKELVIDGKPTVMAFFDLQYNPFSLQSAEDKNYLLVDHNCLKEVSPITFDLFFQLKENNKMLKMFKKDTVMSDKEINSVLEKKVLPLLISMGDEVLWYKYGVEVYLKKL
jgi:hypothetical protein